MQIGIVGLPFSGKSTLFSTLMARKSQDDSGKFKQEAERGIITVPDTRLDRLTEMFNPRKHIKIPVYRHSFFQISKPLTLSCY